MRKHTRIYMEAMGYDDTSWIPCEVCQKTAVDIHHIEGRGKMGGAKAANHIENMVAMCRECHIKYGDKKQFKSLLKSIVSARRN